MVVCLMITRSNSCYIKLNQYIVSIINDQITSLQIENIDSYRQFVKIRLKWCQIMLTAFCFCCYDDLLIKLSIYYIDVSDCVKWTYDIISNRSQTLWYHQYHIRISYRCPQNQYNIISWWKFSWFYRWL